MVETLDNEVEQKERAILSQVAVFDTFSEEVQKKKLGFPDTFRTEHPNLSPSVLAELSYIGIEGEYPPLVKFAEALQGGKCTRKTLLTLKRIPYFQATPQMCKLAIAIDSNKISRETVQKVSRYGINSYHIYNIAQAVED